MRRYLLALPLIAIMAPMTAIQELTIPQAIERMKPGPYVVSRVREVDPLPFEHVVRDADLIVHCSLKKIRTYLSDTQMELFTDYQVIPFTVIAQRQLRASQRPGTQMPIVVRQWGGETTI